MDHFLENLEKFQLEKGKRPDRFIPGEFDNKADTNKILNRGLSLVPIVLLYFMVKQVKCLGSMSKGGGGPGDIFSIGTLSVFLPTYLLRKNAGKGIWP